MTEGQRALVLFSGGQDSATCLAWALEKFSEVETLGFNYGQNHHVELDVRLDFLSAFKDHKYLNSQRLGLDHVLDLGVLGQISDTSLTKEKQLEFNENGIPNTFVPARNLLFLYVSFTRTPAYCFCFSGCSSMTFCIPKRIMSWCACFKKLPLCSAFDLKKLSAARSVT